MRTTYNIELKVDIPLVNEEQKQVFTELVCSIARQLYGPAAVIAKHPPELKVTLIDGNGRTHLDMFAGTALADEEE